VSTDPSHTVWDDEEAAREAAIAEEHLAEDEGEAPPVDDAD
jgi:hypothetical protein